jgi:hypothetical protein
MITKELNNKTFIWDPNAFSGKGYWFVKGKNDGFGRAASKKEADSLGKPEEESNDTALQDSALVTPIGKDVRSIPELEPLLPEEPTKEKTPNTNEVKEIIKETTNQITLVKEIIKEIETNIAPIESNKNISNKTVDPVKNTKDRPANVSPTKDPVKQKATSSSTTRSAKSKKLLDTIVNNLTKEKDVGSSVKDALSVKMAVTAKTLKDKVDPKKISERMLGKNGTKLIQKLSNTGQKKKTKANKIDELAESLNKLYKLTKKYHEEDVDRLKEENKNKKIKDEEEEKWHKDLISAIAGIRGTTVTAKEENNKRGFFDNLKDKFKGKIAEKALGGAAKFLGPKAAALLGTKAVEVAGQSAAKVLGKEATEVAGKTVGKAAIKEIAEKVLSKSLGKVVAKSIPFVGAAAGIGFAVSKLMEGDVVGAGLEAAGGLAGPLTAIPATVASAARDVYQAVYGKYPEQDPDVGKNFEEVKQVTSEVAGELIGKKIQPQENEKQAPSTTTQIGAPTTPSVTPVTPATTPSTTSTPATASPSAKAQSPTASPSPSMENTKASNASTPTATTTPPAPMVPKATPTPPAPNQITQRAQSAIDKNIDLKMDAMKPSVTSINNSKTMQSGSGGTPDITSNGSIPVRTEESTLIKVQRQNLRPV